MNKGLTWKELKALNDLYNNHATKAKIQGHAYIKHLFYDLGLLDHPIANTKVLVTVEGFDEYYETHHLESFVYYKLFLEENNIDTHGNKTFTEEDLRTLMFIKENKNELRSKLTTIEDFSSKIFDYGGSKYLKNRKSLREAVCNNILEIDNFPMEQKEHQWRLVIDCQQPIAVVLCENKAFLKQPWIAKKLNIKLWYAGGNNIAILNDIDEQELSRPIYYSGDWDLAGLQIYSRIKNGLKHRGKSIALLYPNKPHKPLPVDSPYHNSKWIADKELSGLDSDNFESEEILLIRSLIESNQWIEEESNELQKMLSAINLVRNDEGSIRN